MKLLVTAEAERELWRSSLYRWVTGRTTEGRLATWCVVAAVAVAGLTVLLRFAAPSPWVAKAGAVFLGLAVLSYCILVFAHNVKFESALEQDHLIPPGEKSDVKVTLLLIPFGRAKILRRLQQLAESRASEDGSAT